MKGNGPPELGRIYLYSVWSRVPVTDLIRRYKKGRKF
jgi:hypothetical protein